MTKKTKKRDTVNNIVLREFLSNKFDPKKFEIYNGKIDVRGISLPKPEEVQKIKSYSIASGRFLFKNQVYENCDFSFSDFSYAFFEKCTFRNCLFQNTVFKNIENIGCDFVDCSFIKTNFKNSFLNTNKGKNSGSFLGCIFEEANLTKVSLGFPIIDNCTFNNCILKETNFDGSRFSNTTFKGDFISGWFNGYSVYSTIRNSFFIDDKPEKYPNKMLNINFKESNLIDVQFQNKINLTKCSFPKGNKYILIKNLDLVYSELKSKINDYFSEEHCEIIFSWIENLYYSKSKKNMFMDLVNTECRTKYYDKELYDNFFSILREVNSRVNSNGC